MSRAELTRKVGALRHRVPRHLFSVLSILLLLLGPACGSTYAGDDGLAKSVTLFAAGKTKIPDTLDREEPTKKGRKYKSFFFAGGNGVILALSEAWYTNSDMEFIDIATFCTGTDMLDWKSQMVLQKKTEEENEEEEEDIYHYALRNPTAVIKGNKAYLVAFYKRFVRDEYYVDLAVGDITGEGANKVTKWNRSESLISKLVQEIKPKELSVFPGFNNSAFLRSNGRIVFSANATNKEGKWGYAIMQLKDKDEQWEVSFVEKPGECHRFFLFDWKEKLISIFFGCSTDTPYVKEYDEVKKEWKDADDALFHMWRDQHALIDMIPVTIENKSLLLFIEEHFTKENDVSTYKIFFGVSDGIRRFHSEWHNHGYIRTGSGKLLYANDELFFLFEGYRTESKRLLFQPFKEQLETIKSTLKTWDENDAYLSKPCHETVPEGASPDTLCVTPVPTNGLVGFLADNGDSDKWKDEYRCIETYIHMAEKVTNGFAFDESGAVWEPERASLETKQYYFTKYGLTVVATVSVHKTPKNDAPLLTVLGYWTRERFGLWYKDGQWKVVSNGGKEEPAVHLETQKEYRVALIVHNNTISVYVDGKSRGSPLPVSLSEEKPFDIGTVYISGCSFCFGIKMTVTNVLLYNRVLNDTELEAASKTVPPIKRKDVKEKFETPTGSEKITVTSSGSKKTPKTTEQVPESTNKAEPVPEATNKTKPVTEPTNREDAVPEATNKAKPVTEARSMTESAPEATNREDAVPEATNKTKPVTEPTNREEAVSEAATKTKPVTEPTNKTETPRDLNDGSV